MPQPTQALFLTMSIPLCPPCTHPPLMATSSRIMHHVTKLESFQISFWTWKWVHCTKISPTVTRCQPNRASLMWWNRSFVSWICIPQISINWKMLSYQYGPTFLKNAFSTLLNQCHIELRQCWRWKGVKHSIRMVLIIL